LAAAAAADAATAAATEPLLVVVITVVVFEPFKQFVGDVALPFVFYIKVQLKILD
jgi:hypothetical protein